MDKAIKEIWINALRTGGYTQGSGNLRKGCQYCALGVLCDVMGVTFENDAYSDEFMATFPSGERRTYTLPDSFLEQCGLTKDEASEIARWNDDAGLDYTFREIADLISSEF